MSRGRITRGAVSAMRAHIVDPWSSQIVSGGVWVGLSSMVFLKPSTMSRAALSRLTEGTMTTLLSADTQSFLEVAI